MGDKVGEFSQPLPQFDRSVRVLVVAAPYHAAVTAAQVAAARAVLDGAGVTVEQIDVPGAREIPAAIAMAERMAEFDGYVALGTVIDDAALLSAVDHGLGLLGLQGACIGHGIAFGPEMLTDPQNKAAKAAAAALHLIALSRKWAGQTKGIGFRA